MSDARTWPEPTNLMPEPSPELVWPRRCKVPPLGQRVAHVWAFPLVEDPPRQACCTAWLSADEHARARRFAQPGHRRRFILARGTMRQIVATYAGQAPQDLRFRYGPRGKPALDAAGRPLAFNLSHSGDLALLAVTQAGEIGADVEQRRALDDLDRLADRFFSPREARAIARAPVAARPDVFFACWTRKEAYIKALGEGLFRALDRFAVSTDPEGPARLAWVADDPAELERWRMWSLAPAPGYAAALVADEVDSIECFHWSC